MAVLFEAIFVSGFEALVWFIFRCLRPLFGTIFFYTGELTLKFATLGRHKLQPNPYKSGANYANRGKSLALGGLVWLGLIFWGLTARFGFNL